MSGFRARATDHKFLDPDCPRCAKLIEADAEQRVKDKRK